jgi:hypothetical protein
MIVKREKKNPKKFNKIKERTWNSQCAFEKE